MIMTNWHVITGAPSSGKTTIINELAKRGYAISNEIARDYILKEMRECRLTVEEIQHDQVKFQRTILAMELRKERKLDPEKLIFLDRGSPDGLAYFHFTPLQFNQIKKACEHFRYKKVFYCHGLPVEHDGIRLENDEIARKLGQTVLKVYAMLGYQLIDLPVVSIQGRIDIILSELMPLELISPQQV